jgi:SpoVK/Ycf46/Vps4 family AAA+-type ATPase
MNAETWFESNNRYLATSLEWLRTKLAHFPADQSRASSNDGINPLHRWLGKDGRRSPNDLVTAAAAAREEAAKADPPPGLLLLAARFGLSVFERDTLMMCAALDLDPGFAALCAQAQGAPSRAYPTFGLALSVLDDPSWDALSPHRPLRFAKLLEINQPAATAMTAAGLRADERVVNFLKGLNAIDERLSIAIRPVGMAIPLAETQRQVAGEVVAQLRASAQSASLPVIQLAGPDAPSRLAVANEAAEAVGRRLYRIAADAIPAAPAENEQAARLWQRETVLLPVALYIEADQIDSANGEGATNLCRFLQREAGIVFVGVREAPLRLPCASVPFDVAKPTPVEQRNAWLATFEEQSAAASTAALLAGQFHLNLGEIRDAAAAAKKDSGEERERRLWSACRDLSRPQLDQLAQRLEPKATWENFVLPDEQMKLMRQIAGQVRNRHRVYSDWGFGRAMNRGFGINALFAGESGTGKTMGAEVLANDLDLNLYRIDLSGVVSKYIGETEKNLRRLFDAAEQGGAILFFDEADALFGKRSEVRDSHDRYANIEINYLLQRIESFNGLAILATNMRGALDPAFLRRLRFVVTFPFPGTKERKAIWERALPAQAPREGLDYERLARMNLSGGNIHSIALNAAFAAAQNGQKVTMPIVVAAARMELRKLDRPFNEAEFR